MYAWSLLNIVSKKRLQLSYRVFSRDVTTAMLVSPNKGTAAMLVYATSPLGTELYSYANVFFLFGWKRCSLITWVKTLYWCWISLSEANYHTFLALVRFHLLVNAHFPSPFWEKNEINEITLSFKWQRTPFPFLDTEIQLKLKLHVIELDKMKRSIHSSVFCGLLFWDNI